MRVKLNIILNDIPSYLTKYNDQLIKIKTIEFKYYKDYQNKQRFNSFLSNYIIPLKYNNKELIFLRNRTKNENYIPTFILKDINNKIIKEIQFNDKAEEDQLYRNIITNDIN